MNAGDLGLVQADRDELNKAAGLADHPERPVTRVHQPDRGLDDAPEHDLQVQVAADGDNRLEQRVRPVPGGQHGLQPDLQLGEQIVEPQVRQERVRFWQIHHRAPELGVGRQMT